MFQRKSVSIDFTDTIDMTQQEFEPECNINTIFERCTKRGQPIPGLDENDLVYADVSEVGDYQEQQDKIVEGKDIFEALPDNIKEKFGNNVQILFDFMSKHDNAEVAEILGVDISALSQTNCQSSEKVEALKEPEIEAPKEPEKE